MATEERTIREIPLPTVERGVTHPVRVAYLLRNRFPSAPLPVVEAMVEKALMTTEHVFGAELAIETLHVLEFKEILERVPRDILLDRLQGSYSRWKYGPLDKHKDRYMERVASCLERSDIPLEDYATYLGMSRDRETSHWEYRSCWQRRPSQGT